ncbi:MAG: hypothetical protein WGN25_05155 [Candidatus Electrothrix sp. GW3-4]|uniref:TRADD-N-associated membrane domain-containing protein n=1 Tax=Candidatus Electrothrix sp. GW3-4 TaxID=3126740 RepID=UPI0030D496EE
MDKNISQHIAGSSNVLSGTVHTNYNVNIPQQVVGDANIVSGSGEVYIHQSDKGPNISTEQAFERIGAAVKLNLTQLQSNIEQARSESNQFFKLMLIFSAFGFSIVLGGVALLLIGQTTAGIVTAISSIIPEVTAALFFTKDKELRRTIHNYHAHMLDSQRLLTMIDVAETIENNEEKDKMKQRIIINALNIPASSSSTNTIK